MKAKCLNIDSVFTGIDGCKGGWLFTTLNVNAELDIHLFKTLNEGIDIIEKSKVVSIDMPMGLIDHKGQDRICDQLIRNKLASSFKATVFNVPCRQAVYANGFKEANILNKEIAGKGISMQTWNICNKIKELDEFLINHPNNKAKFKESHPELCFAQLKKASLNYKKKTKEGIQERLSLIEQLNPCIKKYWLLFEKRYLKKNVNIDDILDSIVLSYNSVGIETDEFFMIPDKPVVDNLGVSMNVYYFNNTCIFTQNCHLYMHVFTTQLNF